MSLTEKVLRKRHLEECGEGSKKLSDFENDLFYNERELIFDVTQDDFEYIEEDGDGRYELTFPFKLNWLTSIDDFGYNLTYKSSELTYELTTDEKTDPSEIFMPIEGNKSAINFYTGYIDIGNGYTYIKNEDEYECVPSDKMFIMLYGDAETKFTLKFYKKLSKKIDEECLSKESKYIKKMFDLNNYFDDMDVPLFPDTNREEHIIDISKEKFDYLYKILKNRYRGRDYLLHLPQSKHITSMDINDCNTSGKFGGVSRVIHLEGQNVYVNIGKYDNPHLIVSKGHQTIRWYPNENIATSESTYETAIIS